MPAAPREVTACVTRSSLRVKIAVLDGVAREHEARQHARAGELERGVEVVVLAAVLHRDVGDAELSGSSAGGACEAVGEPVGDQHMLLVRVVIDAVVTIGPLEECLVARARLIEKRAGVLDEEHPVGGAVQ